MKEFTAIWFHYEVLSNRYQTAFTGRHTEFGTPFLLSLPQSQPFAHEMISERCKSKSYSVLWENKFSAPTFPETDSVGKSNLIKNYICCSTSLFCLFLVTMVSCAHVKKKHFFKITWQILSIPNCQLMKSVTNCQHPIPWHNHQNWNFSFRNFC